MDIKCSKSAYLNNQPLCSNNYYMLHIYLDSQQVATSNFLNVRTRHLNKMETNRGVVTHASFLNMLNVVIVQLNSWDQTPMFQFSRTSTNSK